MINKCIIGDSFLCIYSTESHIVEILYISMSLKNIFHSEVDLDNININFRAGMLLNRV